ncbi:uncharacterized protein PpBr36_09877 [Pyricularia pennisetigena]|uniref:uncharacterized protein n=1 Tax=Pyricularia pennisetigena TaxID=1578925 RepID=UPI00114FC145|nr:uncharacterized protein PpBr36_09877 [Pyricularia pennisetigena]TLS22298.1 hypothetical protein PpBr36_09877 [Pyricularia pennisetigena]
MSLFGSKRRRPPNSQQPLTSSTAHSDAATAALSAFSSLQHRQSSPSLSEAAAAAALKARPHTPTDVSSVVPRRRGRRAGSANSSHGTASPHPSLRRSLSSGSMGERTFRSPSPHGRQPQGSSGTNGNGVAHLADYDSAPPVPSIPESVQALPSSRDQKRHQGSGSGRTSAPPVRLASQKLKDGGQGTWFGGPAVGDLANVRTSDSLVLSTSTPHSQDATTRPESRTSVNFSYPARQRVGSPPATPLAEEAPLASQPRQHTIASDTDHDGHGRTRSKRASVTTSPPPRQSTPRQRPSSMPDAQELVYDPNSRRMVSKAELQALEQILNGVEPRQAPKQKRPTRAGSHLAKGTLGRAQGSAVPATSAATAAANHSSTSKSLNVEQTTARLSNSTRPTAPISLASTEHPQDADSVRDDTAEAKPRSRHYVQHSQDHIINPAGPGSEVQAEKKPNSPLPSLETRYQERMQSPPAVQHVVQTDAPKQPQPEPPRVTSNVLDSVTSRQHVHTRPERATPVSAVDEDRYTTEVSPRPRQPFAERVDKGETNEGKFTTTDAQSAHAEKLRSLSTSPVRVAHFGPVQRNLSVRHSPPPRSISPRKSALKQHSSPRDGSPRGASSADDASEIGAPNMPSETLAERKKSARVSFDDRDLVLDDSDSSDVAIPQAELPKETKTSPANNRRKWFSNIGRSKRKDDASFDDDEVMKPRPALPSFGSVRAEKKKHVEEVERPLVTPSELTYSPSLPDSPSMQSLVSPVNDQRGDVPQGQSTDRAIAPVIATDYASRFPANTSRYREPLPPVVTSRDGGYLSMSSDSTSESDLESLKDTPTLSTQHSAATSVPDVESELMPTKLATVPETSGDISSPPLVHSQNAQQPSEGIKVESNNSSPIPSISVTEASPTPAQEQRTAKEKLDLPGGFPDEDSDDTIQATSELVMDKVNEPLTRQTVTEPVVQMLDSTKTEHTPATVSAMTTPVQDDSDSDGTSIYSDAYEDLSDIDETGFQSLDAVVDSPVSAGVGRSMNQTTEFPPKLSVEKSGVSEENNPSGPVTSPVDDWEAAKAYWRSLTADKRAQLEREANEEAGADADLEQEARDEPRKPRRKKSVEKRQAEKQAILEAQRDPERTYMIKPGTKVPDEIPLPSNSVLRKSMRQKALEEAAPVSVGMSGRLRKSMRTTTQPPEPAVQAPAQKTKLQRAPAPTLLTTTQAAAGAAHRAHQPASPTATSPPARSGTMTSFFPPVLKRRGSTSSESSFRRSATRRATNGSSAGDSGGFFLRRTMRGSSTAEQTESPSTNPRLSMRSASPGDSMRGSKAPPPPVSMNGSRMRTSLRDAGGKSKLGAKSGGGSSINLSSFGLKSKTKSRGSGSRFGDSSDDDDAGGGGFRSRFEDSSDDEIADAAPKPHTGLGAKSMRTGKSNAAASRASARPQAVQEESPDLPDSSDGELTGRGTGAAVSRAGLISVTRPTRQASTVVGSSLRRSGSGRDSLGNAQALGTSLMRNGSGSGGGSGNGSPLNSPPRSPTNRRGSFMAAVLGRRKSSAPSSPIQRGELMDSAARRDTALERSPAELAAMRGSSGAKLQRRTTGPTGLEAEQWPLATPSPSEEQQNGLRNSERPASAGNLLTGSHRPGILKNTRRTMSNGDRVVGAVGGGDGGVVVVHGDNVDEVVPVVGGEHIPSKTKKKKFGALRRMFRLDD